MESHTNHAYKVVLCCVFTVMLMASNCGNQQLSIDRNRDNQKLYMGRNRDTDMYLRKRKPSQNDGKDDREKAIYERFDSAWARKIKIPSEEQIIEKVIEIIEFATIQWFPEKEPELLSLLSDFAQDNGKVLKKVYSDSNNQLKQWCLQLSSSDLQSLGSKLENNEDKGIIEAIKAFAQEAPASGIKEAPIAFKITLAKRLWIYFRKWINASENHNSVSKEIRELMGAIPDDLDSLEYRLNDIKKKIIEPQKKNQ